ncbi:Eco57I restriction-modification methylase domain-containing protein [Helicobacter pylori]|uniref:type IIG restriction enzyme/methyltransferase n=1 Tax=Helicobacter pylori TaxID=210 RepID=UPI0002BADFDE|nr:Eco57I restriction-modification methylase domain-containing protein [Helicobacter pylori]EMH09662.1 Eco57I restriction endonuclease [Helicobacter pylori GAM250AFi]EMH13511.1 Eco57I restriction endonuclease [Helicobacter pylori GAM250T]EMH15827.1 Eco57I restriction endonuclease [Helicobacter pylori GAM252Bi]EMH16204.1 Eco57I restriction endonuclease [Helicobacter pylori GAM252T]EMH47991.1 Eco57I restriction endonuclease [Helicobacter pylori HP250AFiii]
MMSFTRILLKDFIKKYNPPTPTKETIENFEKEINSLLENAPRQDDEEFQKNEINEFLKNAYGYRCNTNKKVDSAIYVDEEVQVLIEVKALDKKTEFPKNKENPLSKAFCQMVLYFLEEREKEKNNSLKHTIICNAHEFFLFDCKDLLSLNDDKRIKKFYKNYAKKEGTDSSKPKFYEDLEQYLKEDFQGELRYTYFNLNDDFKELPLIYQVLSQEVLLKQKKTLDANTLNKDFYEELLYILGLKEQNEKGKTLIKPSRTQNSLSYALKEQYKNLDDEEVMALLIAWNNRILFLRLLESLLISFEHFEKPFLTTENFKDFNSLNTLFFEVLAKKNSERSLNKEDKILEKIPYLNSSLFDQTPLELKGHEIKLLNNKPLEIYPKSVLKKHENYQKQKDLPLLEYLFEFLRVYDFTTTPKDIKDNQNNSESRLINPSVLGLVFEKLNGYKEGSFYTPSFITSYMCKESITPIVLDKFNQTYNIECENLTELKNYFKDNYSYKEDKRKEYLNTLLTLRICDPAVGSGHFLVSALNEMVLIAYELGLIASLYRHDLRLENDEIIIHTPKTPHTPEDKVFKYTIPHSENDPHHQIQKELFELKKSIIENCLFGVDINPNSCEITKLRLWIELLKYSYYIFEEGKNTNNLETLPNIDINIKCANSLISRFNLNDDLKKIPNIKKKIQEYKDLVAQYKDPNPLYPLNKQDLINKIQDLKNTFSLTLKDPKTKAELEKAIEKHITNYNDFALDDKSLLTGLNYFIPSLFGTPKLSPKEEEEAFASYGRIRALRKKLDDALSGGEYHNAFEWRFEFPEVLDDEGNFLGFDCIIGNPPYIDYRKIDEKTKIFLSKFSSVYKQSKEGSIFVYFIERASQLIIKHGLISFINPIAYLCKTTDYGIRDYIDKNLKITMLIDLSNIKIFESASTYTCINIFKRENKKNEILFLRSDDLNELSNNKDDFLKIPDVNIEHISIFLDPISRHIAERFKTQLGDFCKIFCGLSKTGFRSDVINTNSEKSVYFLESSDIYRYYVNDFGKKFLKRIDDYFSQEKQEIFEQQDIIFMTRMTNQIRCVVVPLGVYGGKVNILHDFRIDRFLILGVLNSKLMTYFYKKKFFPTHMQGGAFGFDTLSVETLPIPQITKSNKPTADKIIALVDKILQAKAKDPKANTQELEKEIDALVYQLYNLTDEEIKTIEDGQ